MTTIRQIPESSWGEIAYPVAICILPQTHEEFAKKWGIAFTAFDDDGLGVCHFSVLELEGTKYWANAHPQGPPEAQLLTLKVLSTTPDSRIALVSLLQALSLQEQQLPWINPDLGPADWKLFRLDDNGNDFLMESFLTEFSANWVRRKYEAKGHKQLYFVRHMPQAG